MCLAAEKGHTEIVKYLEDTTYVVISIFCIYYNVPIFNMLF